MKPCKKCGESLNDEARYCQKCGEPEFSKFSFINNGIDDRKILNILLETIDKLNEKIKDLEERLTKLENPIPIYQPIQPITVTYPNQNVPWTIASGVGDADNGTRMITSSNVGIGDTSFVGFSMSSSVLNNGLPNANGDIFPNKQN